MQSLSLGLNQVFGVIDVFVRIVGQIVKANSLLRFFRVKNKPKTLGMVEFVQNSFSKEGLAFLRIKNIIFFKTKWLP